MIRLDFADWPSVESIGPIRSGGAPSLITGAPPPLPLGSFVIQADPFAGAAPDNDPVTAAEGMRGNAQRALDLMQTTVSANRDLDNLMTSVIDAPDWRDGVTKFDKGLAELKQKHLPRFKDAEDSTAFARELEEFAAIRRIDLKSALARKQQDEALAGLDDALTYYATQAATARHDQFREIAIERGLTAIDRMAAAGYLFPETAKKLEAQFHARIDAADLESIVSANPEEALGILDNPALFPNADAATRERLKLTLDPIRSTPSELVMPSLEGEETIQVKWADVQVPQTVTPINSIVQFDQCVAQNGILGSFSTPQGMVDICSTGPTLSTLGPGQNPTVTIEVESGSVMARDPTGDVHSATAGPGQTATMTIDTGTGHISISEPGQDI